MQQTWTAISHDGPNHLVLQEILGLAQQAGGSAIFEFEPSGGREGHEGITKVIYRAIVLEGSRVIAIEGSL